MGAGALAAKVGSRLAHVAVPVVIPSPAMVASALGAHVVGPSGMGGAGAAAVGAGIGRALGLAPISLLDMIPVITTGVITSGAPDVMLGPGQMAVFAPSLPQPCAPHLAQPIPMGSPTVSIHGMQLVRVGDKTSCGAFVCDGVKTVIIGGAAAPPAPLSMNDVVGSLGAVALGALLEKTGAVQAINDLSTAITEKTDQITAKVDEALNKGFDKLDKTLDKATGAIDKTLDKASGAANKAVDKATGAADKVMDKATGVLDKAMGVVDKAMGVVDKAVGTVDKVVDKATGTIDKVMDKATGVVDKATGVVDKAAGVAGAALGKFGEMIGSVGSATEAILGGAGLAGNKK